MKLRDNYANVSATHDSFLTMLQKDLPQNLPTTQATSWCLDYMFWRYYEYNELAAGLPLRKNR